jgi:SAM-dependent methyltransferase
MNIAIIGGGPSGLFTAYYLEGYESDQFKVTLFEASERLGGKVITRRFEKIPALYEAGLAELYDYSHIGIDPLKSLVRELGLNTIPLRGSTVVLGDTIIRGETGLKEPFGWDTFAAVLSFYRTCADLYPPEDYYESYATVDANHPWADRTFRDVLDEISDHNARRYIEVAVRSDTATEPHLTSALNGLKNALMDDPHYMRLYSIEGGNERIIDRLQDEIDSAEVLTNARVTRVERTPVGRFLVTAAGPEGISTREFDVVIAAVPNYYLGQIDWVGSDLNGAITKHIAYYDRPAHYLRVTIAFERPFWRERVKGAYFMSDAFGGCCIYDEGARHPCEPFGVLAWLIPGNDALVCASLGDQQLITLALQSLPAPLAAGRSLFIEGRVHRWVGSVNAVPGGWRPQGLRERHQPARGSHPELFFVGDYLFDSTLNAASDSADFVSNLVIDLLRRRLLSEIRARPRPIIVESVVRGSGDGHLADDYFDFYDGANDYEDAIDEYFDEDYVCDLIRTIWRWSPPYRLLDCGSANGLTLERFAKKKVEAWGVENSAYIHSRTPAEWKHRNILADVRKLPFPDGHFDFVYETCLCYVPEKDLADALGELFRVSSVGVFFGSITSDMSRPVVEALDLRENVRTFSTAWEWSERFVQAGFRLATADPKVLERAWKIEVESNGGDPPWYFDMEAMRYCFYSKPDAPSQHTRIKRARVAELAMTAASSGVGAELAGASGRARVNRRRSSGGHGRENR